MKKNISLMLGIVITSAVIISVFTSCDTKDTAEEQTLVFARSADAQGFDPARETDGESFATTGEIYEGLVGFTPGTSDIEPVLAESWIYSDDGLVLTFKLRKGVKFHDGTDFNADAVVFNFERQYNENHEYNKYGPWKYWGYMDFANIIKDVQKVDDYTVQFNLLKPDAPFLSSLGMNFIAMVSPTAVKKHKEQFTNNPVGTGPFMFKSWIKGDSTVLVANENYWRGAPKLKTVIFKVIPDPTARALALKNGEIDIFVFPSPDDIEGLAKEPNIVLDESAGLNIGYLSFNTQREPFNDVRVRQALNYAIDKKAIIKVAYGNLGQELYAPIPPAIWAYNDNITKYKYDPAKAKALLAEAGYPDGFSAEMWPLPVSRPYMPQGQKVAEVIQQQFAEVGVTANLQTLEWGAHLEGTDHGEYDMAFLGWIGDNGDPDNFLSVLLASTRAVVPASNIAFWKNEEFTSLTEKAATITNKTERKKLYYEAIKIFAKEVPWAVIANSKSIIPMNKKVKGFVYTPVGEFVNLRNVYIKE